ncbi:MAG: transmembrane domain-containing protein, partial [Gammaproteobacteria bacterium]|nr:transmembrane domain-containing protein [Gammaproteobacteria bacterium]
NKDKKENEINWTLIIMSIVVGNLLIVGVLGGGYFYLKRRKEKMAASLGDEMDEDSVSHDTGSK